jgi:glycosyltransferase involved in cell wall biosynthesis
MITFTIITPVFNGEEYIEETILSVLKNINTSTTEYIIVNDGSTDSTRNILKKYENKVKIIDKVNGGEASAVNTGLILATGKYALVVSSDDPMCSSVLLDQACNYFEKNPKTVCVYPDWKMIDRTGATLRTEKLQNYSKMELIGKFNCLVGPGGVFRIKEAKKIGLRNQKFKFVSDYDFWLRLSTVGDFYHLASVEAQWRYHDGSTSIKLQGKEMALERILVIEDFVRDNSIERNLRKMAIANAYFYAAKLVFHDVKIPARRWVLKSVITWPGIVNEKGLIQIVRLLLPKNRFLIAFARKMKNNFGTSANKKIF